METVAAQYEQLPIECIQASRTNPRRHFDDASQAELTASIAEMGLQVPLLVRPGFDSTGQPEEGMFEIVAGERRYRSVKALGHETVACLVREMTDEEAREIQIVENLQRADVQPLEEAEAFQAVLQVRGSISAVAARFGKEESYVAKILRLTSLTQPSRDALRGRLITIDHALLLARLAETEQNAALKWTLDPQAGVKTTVDKVLQQRIERRQREENARSRGEGSGLLYVWEPESVVQLKRRIEARSGIPLARAPWPLDFDDLLPDVVCCNDCPQNTKANSPLFGDLEMGEATCTNGVCFQAKTETWVRISMRTAPGDFPLPRLSWKLSSVKPSIVGNQDPAKGPCGEQANPAKVLKYGQWLDAKPGSCSNVCSGITVDWSDAGDRGYMGGKQLRKPGEVLSVCIAVGCKTHPKAWEKQAASHRQQRERCDPEAQKRAEEQAKHVVKVETEIRSKILHAILSKLDAAKAVRLVADRMHDAAEWRERLLATMPELNGESLEAFTVLCSQISHHVQPSRWQLMQKDGVATDRKQIFALAKAVGVDAAKVTAKFFHDQRSIAPYSDRLYPKGIPWPGRTKPAAAKKAAVKKAAKKKSPKKAAKKGAA